MNKLLLSDHLFGIVVIFIACLTAIQKVPGLIPGNTLENFLEV